MLEPAPNPAHLPAPASYHWTPSLQAEFLGHLAAMASVRGAALFVQMSPRAAYDLRQRRDGLLRVVPSGGPEVGHARA